MLDEHMHWQSLDFSDYDHTCIEEMLRCREEVLAIFGIPPEMLGLETMHINEINETTQTASVETPSANDEPVIVQYEGTEPGNDEGKAKKQFKPNRAQRRAFMKVMRHLPLSQKMRRVERAGRTASTTCPQCQMFYFVPLEWPPILRSAVRCQCQTFKQGC